MDILITGSTGNLGGFLTRRLANSSHHLRLMVHHRPVPFAPGEIPNSTIYPADLSRPESLLTPCRRADCIVHFAGQLFAPHPERFLPTTNVIYVQNLLAAALEGGVGKFILVSFPHVEGESTPQNPAKGLLQGNPGSVHAQTRLEAEKALFKASEGASMLPLILRPGMIYAKGVLMIDAARWLMRRRLLGVWRRPTWIHLLALPDFLEAAVLAIEQHSLEGIINLGDDHPLTLQHFLDTAASVWECPRPWRAPDWVFPAAGWAVETFASIFRTPAPLTRDFIKIGMASYTANTGRMKTDLGLELRYPSLKDGLELLK